MPVAPSTPSGLLPPRSFLPWSLDVPIPFLPSSPLPNQPDFPPKCTMAAFEPLLLCHPSLPLSSGPIVPLCLRARTGHLLPMSPPATGCLGLQAAAPPAASGCHTLQVLSMASFLPQPAHRLPLQALLPGAPAAPDAGLAFGTTPSGSPLL